MKSLRNRCAATLAFEAGFYELASTINPEKFPPEEKAVDDLVAMLAKMSGSYEDVNMGDV